MHFQELLRPGQAGRWQQLAGGGGFARPGAIVFFGKEDTPEGGGDLEKRKEREREREAVDRSSEV